ncbi:kielin/chordin-like protein, partial [Lates japonicus]
MTLLQKHLRGSPKYQRIHFAKSHYSDFVSGGFDTSGFDQHGYDRDGYDRSGWDRWGYGKDGFSRDFIDRDGYDIPGFSRYGFNRFNVTWFGMHRDGVFQSKKKKEHHREEDNDGKTQRDKIISELFSDKGCELDGTVHNVSYSTLDGCQTCTCKGGHRECSPLPCPSLDCTQTETVPGDCCQHCRSCIDSGVRYDHGATWRPGGNSCEVCHCLEGHVNCEREQCHTPCKNPTAPPPNSCCPSCNGCGVNGHDFPNGAVIPTGDRCQECTCVNGNMVCSPLPCPAVSCQNPVRRAGDCCPRCEQCVYESKVYVDGQTFPSRRDPCLHCRCSAGEVSCERMDASCPTPRCRHPAKRKGECCATCDVCEYDRRVYADGEVFTPPGTGPCLQCRCKGGNVICHEEKCPPVQCSNPIVDPHLCCPVCK